MNRAQVIPAALPHHHPAQMLQANLDNQMENQVLLVKPVTLATQKETGGSGILAVLVTLTTRKEGGLGIPAVPVTLTTRKEGGLGIPVRQLQAAAVSVSLSRDALVR